MNGCTCLCLCLCILQFLHILENVLRILGEQKLTMHFMEEIPLNNYWCLINTATKSMLQNIPILYTYKNALSKNQYSLMLLKSSVYIPVLICIKFDAFEIIDSKECRLLEESLYHVLKKKLNKKLNAYCILMPFFRQFLTR